MVNLEANGSLRANFAMTVKNPGLKKRLGIAAMKRSRGGDDVVDSCALVVSSEPAKVVKLFPSPIEN